MQDPFKPEEGEVSPGLSGYLKLALEHPLIIGLLKSQQQEISALAAVPAEKFNFRYAPGKWSGLQLLGHLIDSERVFTYRALRFARNDLRPQDGFDENSFAEQAGSDERSPAAMIEEFKTLRASTIAFFESLPPPTLLRSGEANGKLVTVRGLAAVTAGHVQHHLKVLKEKYKIPA